MKHSLTMKDKFSAEEAKKIFFTSDTHFGHTNIIKYCNRPFNTIVEHNKTIIENWNRVVPEDALVFHLGDVGIGDKRHIMSTLDKLHGKICLIIGNHDWRNILKYYAERFEECVLEADIKIDGQHIILNHYPLLCYAGAYHKPATWQLYGHVHSGPLSPNGLDNPRLKMCFPQQYDVGVDNNDFTPVSFEQLKTIIKNREEHDSRFHSEA